MVLQECWLLPSVLGTCSQKNWQTSCCWRPVGNRISRLALTLALSRLIWDFDTFGFNISYLCSIDDMSTMKKLPAQNEGCLLVKMTLRHCSSMVLAWKMILAWNPTMETVRSAWLWWHVCGWCGNKVPEPSTAGYVTSIITFASIAAKTLILDDLATIDRRYWPSICLGH